MVSLVHRITELEELAGDTTRTGLYFVQKVTLGNLIIS